MAANLKAPTVRTLVAIAFAVGLSVAIRLEWFAAGVGSGGEGIALGQPAVWWLQLVILTYAICAVVEAHRPSAGLRYSAVLMMVICLAFSVVSLFAAEVFSSVLPEVSTLNSLAKVASGLTAGAGPWWTAALSIVAGFALFAPSNNKFSESLTSLGADKRTLFCLVAALATGGTLVFIRTRTWIRGDFGSENVQIAGATLPWLGGMTFFALIVLASGVAAYTLRHRIAGALAITWCGWMFSFSAATIIATDPVLRAASGGEDSVRSGFEQAMQLSEKLLPAQANEIVRAELAGQHASVALGLAAWSTFALGLALALLGVGLLRRETATRS